MPAPSPLSREALDSLLSNANLRATKQRRAVYTALAATDQHPTADDLHHAVQTSLPGISLATVYNTLEAFTDAGLVHKLPSNNPNGSARYDADCHHHLHVRCAETGRVADIPEDLSRQLLDMLPDARLAELEDRLGFTIDQVQIELLGRFHPSA
ncbi:MAG: Fur family transcriptional regulator [Planctomycetota bacterium]